jgi:predicted DNA-binding transcriptional regulator AlpA
MSSVEHIQASSVEPVLVTARQLASMLQVSTRTLWRMRSAARLPAPVRLGGSVRWRLDDVTSWIEKGCPEQARCQNGPRR